MPTKADPLHRDVIEIARALSGALACESIKSMRVQHGPISVDVPSDWTDRSTLVFVGSAPAPPTVSAIRVAQPSLSITFARAPQGEAREAARAVLEEELAGLRQMALGLELVSIEDFDAALGPGAASVHKLTLDGVALRQIHAVVITGGVAVRAVAACGEFDFPGTERTLRNTLTSLSLASGK